MRMTRVTDAETVRSGAHLFDGPPIEGATERFLAAPGHHLIFAFDEGSAIPIGFVSGVETTHPDKGTELFLYELGVDESARGRGVGAALVEALAALAKELGCYGMWTATEPDNIAALKTYRRAGAGEEELSVFLAWDFDPSTGSGSGAVP